MRQKVLEHDVDLALTAIGFCSWALLLSKTYDRVRGSKVCCAAKLRLSTRRTLYIATMIVRRV